MIKKLAMLAAAGLLYIAAPTAPASAQGISVQIGGGHHGYHGHRGYHRGHGYRGSRAYYAPRHRHHGPRHYHGGRTKTIIVR